MDYLTVDIGNAFLGPASHPLKSIGGLGEFVNLIVSNAIAIAGIILIFLIVIGGISMVTGAGSGNAQQVSRGREIIVAAVVGFLIIIAAYYIVLFLGRSTATNLIQ